MTAAHAIALRPGSSTVHPGKAGSGCRRRRQIPGLRQMRPRRPRWAAAIILIPQRLGIHTVLSRTNILILLFTFTIQTRFGKVPTGLIRSFCRDGQIVILPRGADWGGELVWRVAMWHGEVVQRLVTMAGAHPLLFQRDMDLDQFWRCERPFLCRCPDRSRWQCWGPEHCGQAAALISIISCGAVVTDAVSRLPRVVVGFVLYCLAYVGHTGRRHIPRPLDDRVDSQLCAPPSACPPTGRQCWPVRGCGSHTVRAPRCAGHGTCGTSSAALYRSSSLPPTTGRPSSISTAGPSQEPRARVRRDGLRFPVGAHRLGCVK